MSGDRTGFDARVVAAAMAVFAAGAGLGYLARGGVPGPAAAGPPAGASTRVYRNALTPVADPKPLLADYPEFVAPVAEAPGARFEAPVLVDEPGADLEVRAWRFSYNARGIVEIPNRVRGDRTA